MGALEMLANARYGYDSGTGSDTVTIEDGALVGVISVRAPAGANASLTIKPGGSGQAPVVGPVILVLAGTGFAREYLGQLGAGTVIDITDSASWFVDWVFPAGAS